MQAFLKFLRVFFVILGVVFFLMIIAGFYLYQSDFYGVKTIMNYNQEDVAAPNSSSEEGDKNPGLSAEQEAQLESVGIDPAQVPTEITPEMEECFIEKLGEERVREIEAGSSPRTMEMIKVEPCL